MWVMRDDLWLILTSRGRDSLLSREILRPSIMQEKLFSRSGNWNSRGENQPNREF